MRVAVSAVLLVLSISMLLPSGISESTEERREYIGGGSMMGTGYFCTPSLPADIQAACNIPCPGGTCNITVIDDVRGTNILFRICFDGETFCRPNGYIGHANVPGSKVTVVPSMTEASHGVVIVR